VTTLRVFEVNSQVLAVREEEVLTVADWTEPTPLPFAPSSVLGIVSIQGRMFTVVDIDVLLESDSTTENLRFIMALRGDEQLAIAANNADQIVESEAEDKSQESNSNLVRGRFIVNGRNVSFLEVENLFAGVIRGRERRQRRF
jgi:chemotaxis signal transduction protein